LEDVSAAPQRLFVLAGSKGREYLDRGKRRGRLPVDKAKQKKLDRLNRRLEALLRDPRYQAYALIGSGLQFKFGQTTVARQDIYGSIPQSESREFMSTVQQLIGEIDPADEIFRIEDTGKDIEIILTVEGEGGLRDFDKGDGVLFLDGELGLALSRGPNLICGDTSSDIPMASAAAGSSIDTWTIFVTRDEGLKDAVRRVCRHVCFVSEPDVLVTALNNIGGKVS